jgi:DNA-binding MarR family transcriptional regulator
VAAGEREDGRNLAQLLRMPFQALVAELHRRLALAGYGDIRPAYTSVFALLDERGMRLGELAERAQLTKQLMNYLVGSLEELGYVERLRDPADGRARIVRFTERGLDASRAGRAIIDQIEQEWSGRLPGETLPRLRRDLGALVEALQTAED